MSTKAITTTTNNNYFSKLSNDFFTSIFEFLDDKTIIATVTVCKDWLNESVLQARNEAITRFKKQYYPEPMIQLFQSCNLPIAQLPVLNLSAQKRDYIDFIQPEEMSHSVMRFRDSQKRFGIALKIQAPFETIRRRELGYISQFMEEAWERRRPRRTIYALKRLGNFLRNWGQNKEIVLAIFKRHANPNAPSYWTYGWGNSDKTIDHLYTVRHEENGHVGSEVVACPTCPFISGRVHETVLRDLLTNQDPDFKLPEHNGNQIPPGTERSLLARARLITSLALWAIVYLVCRFSSALVDTIFNERIR